jgi:hypothetical protein
VRTAIDPEKAYAIGRGPWTSRFVAIGFFNSLRGGECPSTNRISFLNGR